MQANKSKTAAAAVIGSVLLAAGVYFQNKVFTNVSFAPVAKTEFVILAGHGSKDNGQYQTAGKQSPTWPDSLKIYEGYSCKLLALQLVYKLNLNGIDATLLNNYNTDLSLFDRAAAVANLFKIDNRVVLIELHHNATQTTGADYTDFEGLKGFTSAATGGATGTEFYTSPGATESDNFVNNYLIPNIKGYLPGLVLRNNGKGREANFYMLTQTKCPAVIIEFCFMTTYTDCLIIADFKTRNLFTDAITAAAIAYQN